MSKVESMLTRLRIMPRWFIFCLDLVVVALALLLSYCLRFNFDFAVLSHIDIRFALAIVLLSNMIAFLAFRNHIGIVRYTAISDTLRLLQLCFVTSIFFWATGQVLNTHFNLLFPASVVAINFFLSFSLLFGYWLLVRAALHKSQFFRSHIKQAPKAVIYGSSAEAVLIGQMFYNSPNPVFRVVAFVDADRAKMRIVGLPVVAPEEKALKSLVEQGVTTVLLPDYESGGKKLNDFMDLAFRCGISNFRKLPPVQHWMDGRLEADQIKEVRIEDLLDRAPIQINNKKVSDSIKGKRVLITGAAGSIGSELVRQIIRLRPSAIVLVDIAETPLHELLLELREFDVPDCNIYPMIGDITDRSRMEYVFDIYHPEIVFHAAAYKHVPLMEDNPSIAVLNNVVGTRNLVELSAQNVETFVLVSTDKAVNPTNVMGASKRIAEIYMQSLSQATERLGKDVPKTKFITTRFGNVLGSNGSVIPRFKQQIAAGGPVTVTHPDINRFFMTIAEACQLVIEASVMGEGGEIFVFDMGEPVKIVDLAEKMIRLSGKIPGRDIEISFTGLRPGEKLYEEVLAKAEETLPTYHNKIKIASVRPYELTTVVEMIDDLVASAHMHYVLETVQRMKKIVPEFLSKNSPFERLDVVAKSQASAEQADIAVPAESTVVSVSKRAGEVAGSVGPLPETSVGKYEMKLPVEESTAWATNSDPEQQPASTPKEEFLSLEMEPFKEAATDFTEAASGNESSLPEESTNNAESNTGNDLPEMEDQMPEKTESVFSERLQSLDLDETPFEEDVQSEPGSEVLEEIEEKPLGEMHPPIADIGTLSETPFEESLQLVAGLEMTAFDETAKEDENEANNILSEVNSEVDTTADMAQKPEPEEKPLAESQTHPGESLSLDSSIMEPEIPEIAAPKIVLEQLAYEEVMPFAPEPLDIPQNATVPDTGSDGTESSEDDETETEPPLVVKKTVLPPPTNTRIIQGFEPTQNPQAAQPILREKRSRGWRAAR